MEAGIFLLVYSIMYKIKLKRTGVPKRCVLWVAWEGLDICLAGYVNS
jgi:hypothetical protein